MTFTDQLKVDLAGGPLVRPAKVLDPRDHIGAGERGAAVRGAGTVDQPGLAEALVAAQPLGQRLAGHACLGRDVRDRTVLAALDQTQSSGRGQRSVSVGHEG